MLMIGLGLLVIAFFVFIFFSAKTWRVIHIILVCLLFLACGYFAVLATWTLKTHATWRREYVRLEGLIEQEEVKINQLTSTGAYPDLEGKLQKVDSSIPQVESELAGILIDRGRVWRNTVPGGLAGDSVKADVVSADTPDDEIRPHQIKEGMLLHAFRERMDDAVGGKVPAGFIGSFEVTAVTPRTITLKPTLPLTPNQAIWATDTTATWALYDTMPTDRRDVFEGFTQEELIEIMPRSGMAISDERYQRVIDQFVRDQSTEVRPDDDPTRIWKRVRFTEFYPPLKNEAGEEVPGIEVDAGENAPRLPKTYFDEQGRALAAPIRIGETAPADDGGGGGGEVAADDREAGRVRFEPGDEAVLYGPNADELIAAGVCELVEGIYLRELRDYDYQFANIFSQLQELEDASHRIRTDTQVLIDTGRGSVETVESVGGERNELSGDLARLNEEKRLLIEYLDALKQQHAEVFGQLSTLYRQNVAVEAELDKVRFETYRRMTGAAKAAEERAAARIDRELLAPQP